MARTATTNRATRSSRPRAAPVGGGRERAHRAAHRRRGRLLHDGPLQPLRRQGRRGRRALRRGLRPALSTAMSAMPKTDDPLADLRRVRALLPRHRARQRDALHGDVRRRGARLRAVRASHADRARRVRAASWPRCSAASTPASSSADADEIAEVLWGSIHGLVMLELVGIDPLKSDPGARFDRLRSTPCFDGFCTWLIRCTSPGRARLRRRPRSTASSTSRSTCAPRRVRGPVAARTDRQRAGPAADEPGGRSSPRRRRWPAQRARGRDEVVEGGDQGPAAVAKAIKIGARRHPDRAAARHHHPARHPRAAAARVVPDPPPAGRRRRSRPGPRALADPLALRSTPPAGRPSSRPASRTAGAVARQWVLRSLGGDAESAVRARARRQAEALDRLDLRAVSARPGGRGTARLTS